MKLTYKNPSIVSGMTVKDILNMDENIWNRLTAGELRQVTGRLVSAGNKRIRNLERQENSSPALRAVNRSGGKFSTRGKNFSQLKSEFARAKNFLQQKTSTVKGWKKVKQETRNKLGIEGINFTDNQWDNFWKTYNKLKELNPDVELDSIKYNVFKTISTRIIDKNETPESIAIAMNKEVNNLYEWNKELEQQRISGGVSEYFDWE